MSFYIETVKRNTRRPCSQDSNICHSFPHWDDSCVWNSVHKCLITTQTLLLFFTVKIIVSLSCNVKTFLHLSTLQVSKAAPVTSTKPGPATTSATAANQTASVTGTNVLPCELKYGKSFSPYVIKNIYISLFFIFVFYTEPFVMYANMMPRTSIILFTLVLFQKWRAPRHSAQQQKHLLQLLNNYSLLPRWMDLCPLLPLQYLNQLSRIPLNVSFACCWTLLNLSALERWILMTNILLLRS